MANKRRDTLAIGVISEATLRDRDLIESFLWELERLHLSRSERAKVREIRARFNAAGEDSDYWQEESGYDNEELVDLLSNHCPEYAYFGTQEGDGACFGVWPSIDSLEEDARTGDVLKVSDSSEVPAGEKRLVMQVSDHGNVTLARYVRGRFQEVWSIV